MSEEDAPERATKGLRGWTVGLGAVGVAGLLVVTAMITLPRLGASNEPDRSIQPRPVNATPSPTSLPPVTSAARTIKPLKGRVLFGVQSIGADIVKGIPGAFKAAGMKNPRVMTWSKARNSKGPLIATARIGKNGNPSSKLRAFAALVNDAPRGSVDVALMAFNYQDVTAATDVDGLAQSYSETMESVEQANPDITFIYTTVPVTTSNSWRAVDRNSVNGLIDVDQPVWQDNIARERLNALIRERYAATGRLYDIAALQARINGTKATAKAHENQFYYVMNPALSRNGKELNRRGSTQLAKEMSLLISASNKA